MSCCSEARLIAPLISSFEVARLATNLKSTTETFGVGTREAKTLTVVAGAEVVELIRSQGVFGQGNGSLTALTLSVAPDDAVFVAFSARNGELDVVRATGAPVASRQRFELGQVP